MFEQIGNLVDDFVRAYLRKTKTLLALGEPARRRPQRETVPDAIRCRRQLTALRRVRRRQRLRLRRRARPNR